MAGENALYVTLSEPRSELEASARSHGWKEEELSIAEFIPEEASLSPEQQYTVFHPSEVELASTIQKLTQLIEERKPTRLVIDSLSELRLLAADTMRYRRQLLALKQFFAGRDTTVLLLDDRSAEGSDMQLQSIAHGVIRLNKVQQSYGANPPPGRDHQAARQLLPRRIPRLHHRNGRRPHLPPSHRQRA